MYTHPYTREMPSKDKFHHLLMGEGIWRSRHVKGISLLDGGHVDVDLIVISHKKHFPDMKHIITTALGPNQQPIGFKDAKLNKVGMYSVKCFGGGGECLPSHLARSWQEINRGVPYRDLRLSEANPYAQSFMIHNDYLTRGLDQGLTALVNDYARLLGAKDEWIEQ